MSDEAVKLARAIETAQCVCDSEEYDSDDLLRLRDVTPMLLEEMAKLRADNDVLRTQVEYRAEPLGLDDWARQLLDKYTGYPHVNADPFDSLDMGQRQMLIWEYASELLVRGKRIDELLAIAEAAMVWRHSMVEVTPGCYVDADDGNVDQGLESRPARNALIAAVDAARKAGT